MTSNLDCSASALMAEITAHLRAVVLAQPLSVLDLALWEMNGSCANTMADSAVAVPMETLTAGDRLPSAADFESGGDRAASRVAELFHKYRLYELRILLHDHANEHGHMSYQDPITNDIVATSSSLEQREVIAEGIFKRALELCPKLQRLLQRGNSESLRSHGEGDGQQLIALLQAIDFLRCRHAAERHCPHGPSQTNFSPSMSATTSVEVTPRVASVDDVREILSGEYSSRHGAQPTIVPCSQAGVEADVPLPHLNNTDWWRLDQWSSRRHPVRKGRAAEESSLNSLNGLGSPAGRRADARGQQSPMEATFDAERVSCSSDSASGVELDEREDEDFVSEGSELEGEEGEESESPSTDGDDAEADADGVDDHSDRAWNVSSVRVQPTFQFRETPLRAGYSGHRFVLDELPEADVVRLKDLPHYLLTHQMNLEASSRQRQCYQDPVTGCAVLTSYFLQQFRSCFGEYCLHCPHGAACQRQLEESMLRMEESSSSSGSSAVSVSTEEMAEEQLGLPVAMPATPGGFVIAAKSLEDLLRWGLKPRASQPKPPLMELGDGASAATELPHPASPTNEEESLRSREQLERQAFSLRKFDFLDCSGL